MTLAPEHAIGVFDSGVGGLTVLDECLAQLPAEDFVYFGDTAWFPYGDRSDAELRGEPVWPLGLEPVSTVDTSVPVDIPQLAARLSGILPDTSRKRCGSGLRPFGDKGAPAGTRLDGAFVAKHAECFLRGGAADVVVAGEPVEAGNLGGFNRSSQHLDSGGVDGQASWVDDGVDRAVADEVAGCAGAPTGGRARVLA